MNDILAAKPVPVLAARRWNSASLRGRLSYPVKVFEPYRDPGLEK